MNPYQVMGVIACCVSMFVGVVTFLTFQGVPLLASFLGVYLVAVCCMLGMQRRARESCESREYQRRLDCEPSMHETRKSDTETDTETGADGGVDTSRTPGVLPKSFRA